jgi:cysteine-rich repeat protein
LKTSFIFIEEGNLIVTSLYGDVNRTVEVINNYPQYGEYLQSSCARLDEPTSGSYIVLNDCSATLCGNGILEVGEECDDGDSRDTNYCNNNCQLNCVETDDGEDFYHRGNLSWRVQNFNTADVCRTNTTLVEFSCLSDGGYEDISYNCPYGCYDGECKPDVYFGDRLAEGRVCIGDIIGESFFTSGSASCLKECESDPFATCCRFSQTKMGLPTCKKYTGFPDDQLARSLSMSISVNNCPPGQTLREDLWGGNPICCPGSTCAQDGVCAQEGEYPNWNVSCDNGEWYGTLCVLDGRCASWENESCGDCQRPVCGNQVIEEGEVCDGYITPGTSTLCADHGDYVGGYISCGNDCQWDYSNCTELPSAQDIISQIEEQQEKTFVTVIGEFASATDSGAANDLNAKTGVRKTMFDTQLSKPPRQHVISIGGPCVNSVSASLLEISGSQPGCYENFPVKPGQAIVQVVEQNDFTGVVVAGYSAEDTIRAGQFVRNRLSYLNESYNII